MEWSVCDHLDGVEWSVCDRSVCLCDGCVGCYLRPHWRVSAATSQLHRPRVRQHQGGVSVALLLLLQ